MAESPNLTKQTSAAMSLSEQCKALLATEADMAVRLAVLADMLSDCIVEAGDSSVDSFMLAQMGMEVSKMLRLKREHAATTKH